MNNWKVLCFLLILFLLVIIYYEFFYFFERMCFIFFVRFIIWVFLYFSKVKITEKRKKKRKIIEFNYTSMKRNGFRLENVSIKRILRIY